ncbi:hypothetical protein WJX72_007528 [[Myrmecia] bisecta]|uniref:Sister chromatid cohesion protein n=1 Tax=[Myrmecia] bisecta TaxID=41462 RepID=A0AAW1R7J5_9CHLO
MDPGIPPIRLTSLAQTPLTHHLQSVVAPVPVSTAAAPYDLSQEQAFAQDPAVVQQVLAQLLAADTRYVHPRYQVPCTPGPGGPLQQQLRALATNVFTHAPAAPPLALPLPHLMPVGSPKTASQSLQAQHDTTSASTQANSQRSNPQESCAAWRPDQGLPPAAKRRRTTRTRFAETVDVQTPEDHAGSFLTALGPLLQKLQQLQLTAAMYDGDDQPDNASASASDGVESEDDEHAGHAAVATLQKALRLVHTLNEELVKVCAGRALHLVDIQPLLSLLGLLGRHVAQGQARVLSTYDDDSSEPFVTISLALESATACLHIITAPDMPKQVHNEEMIEKVVELIKFHTMSNVLAFHDARLRQAHRPALLDAVDDDDEGPSTKKARSAKKNKKAASCMVTWAVNAVEGRLQTAVALLGDLFGVVQLQSSLIGPLLRTMSQALCVEGVDVLQVKTVGLLVSGFRHFGPQRQAVMDDILGSLLPNLPTGRRTPRSFVVGEDAGTCIQMVSALIIQMLQVCVELPPVDSPMASLRDCYAPAIFWADAFWNGCFDRFPNSRATKTDTELDFKQLVEQIVADALAVVCLADWPAAALLLVRFVSLLGGSKGVNSSDTGVRQISMDLLGSVAGTLCRDAVAMEADQDWLAATCNATEGAASSAAASPEVSVAAQDLLLQHLGSRERSDRSLAASARCFMLCRIFLDELQELQLKEAAEEAQVALVTQYRERMAVLDRTTSEDIGPDEAVRLARAVVQGGPLGRSRSTLIKWLVEACDVARQNTTTRAKAVKALGAVIEADPRMLGLPEVQAGINRALQDEAVSVREAGVELLGRHIVGRQELALAYFDTLVYATKDSGTSVRKRALKILWDCCIRPLAFPKATAACVAVLQRAVDNEESIHDLVSKVFHGLWFASGMETGPDGRQVVRGPAERAQQLADVALAVYEATGDKIHLPLEPAHPLVAVLRQALALDVKEAPRAERVAGQQIAAALLEDVVQAKGGAQAAPECLAFPFLIGLHAFAMTDVALCMPADDPARFARTLAPYLKVGTDPSKASEVMQRRKAEQLLCILAITDSVLAQLGRAPQPLVEELKEDLFQLISKHTYVQVVAAACSCLCSLAKAAPAAVPRLAFGVQLYRTKLEEFLGSLGPDAGSGSPSPSAEQLRVPRMLSGRFLFILGHLCRHAPDLIDQASGEGNSPTVSDCLETFVSFFHAKYGGLRVQEQALQALGNLAIARPSVLLGKQARAILQSVLSRSAPTLLKSRALQNLADMLKVEEERLVVRQAEAERQRLANETAVVRKGKGKAEAAAPALPTQNGEGDSLAFSSGILQEHWDAVLALATDTSLPSGTPGCASKDPGDPHNAMVRRRALEVIGAVLKGGLVAPWTAIPHLVALTTDPCRDVGGKALQHLRLMAEKHADLFQSCLADGLLAAADFQNRLYATFHPGQAPLSGPPEDVVRGMGLFYSQLVQPQRAVRTDFLQKLLKWFDSASNLHLASGAATADLPALAFCAHVAAALPMKRSDEPYTLVHAINAVVSRRGEDVLAALKKSLVGEVDQLHNNAAVCDDNVEHGSALPPQGASSSSVRAECKASLAVSMLLMLKQYLKDAYSMTNERIAAFNPSLADKRKQEERIVVAKQASAVLMLHKLRLGAPEDPVLIKEQYQVFKHLMKADAADYGEGVVLGRKRAVRDGDADAEPEQLPDELLDEVDAFHKSKDKINLNPELEPEDSDGLDEEEVLNLGAGEDSEKDDEYDSDEDLQGGGRLAALTRQEKILRAKLKLQEAEDEGRNEDEEGDEGDQDRMWGANKRTYYHADNEDYELTDDEEALDEEGEEARRLQREAAQALQPEDYEQDSQTSSSGEDDDEEGTLGQVARQAGKGGRQQDMVVEELQREGAPPDKEQRMAALMADAPELVALLADLQANLAEVRSRVGPLLKEVKEGQVATAEGVSYLEAKHLLLLNYCTNIVFYLLLKAEGRPVRDHPVISRLVELRAYLEKIRPIDRKLQYQMDKLLLAAQTVQALQNEGDDPLRYGPKPDALVPKTGGAAAADAGGVYRPPKLNPVAMEDPDRDSGAKERRRAKEASRRAARSSLVQELAQELEGAPEELRAGPAGGDTAGAIRQRHRLEARAAEEEDLMIRVPLSKEERKRVKAQQRAGLSGKALLDDFADDVADLIQATERPGGASTSGLDDAFTRQQVSQKYGADLFNQMSKKGRSGDDDLPLKQPLHERRAKFDSVKAKRSMQDSAGLPQKRREREEDEVYKAAKTAAVSKKKARKELYKRPDPLPPLADPTAEGARKITTEIDKNRGLTPHRRKDMKNPRKKHRMKFEDAKTRRKGQVQEVRPGGNAYAGEETGIKSRVSRSTRF